jgi:hypothetical protein
MNPHFCVFLVYLLTEYLKIAEWNSTKIGRQNIEYVAFIKFTVNI